MRSSASLAIGEAGGGMDIEEFAPDMRPAGGLGDPVAGEQLVEPGIAVGMDDAAEVLQVGPRVLALAVGRVEEQRRRRPRAGEGPLVADIGPQPPGLGLAGARRQHRHRRVVDMQGVGGHHIGGERVDQRLAAPPPSPRPSRTGSRSPGSRPRGRRSRPGGRAADGRRTWTRRYAPAAPRRRGRGRSRDRAPAPRRPYRRPGRTASRGRAGSP